MKPIVVWGGTGQALVLSEFVASIGYSIKCVIDQNRTLRSPINGVPIVHSLSELVRWRENLGNVEQFGGIVAIGGDKGSIRLELGTELKNVGIEIVSATHPAAYVSQYATLGEGFQAMAGAIVGTHTRIGRQCIINTGAIVDHECALYDGVHVGPGSRVAGCVTIGENSFLGAGSIILPRIKIGRNVIVGAGSVVTKDIPDDLVVKGNPARKSAINETSLE